MSFSDAELDRYQRQIMLREIGGPGQRALRGAQVTVIGAGGLGAPALLYLAATGIGRLRIIDDDQVDLSNLHRQVIHDSAGIGTAKTTSAATRIKALNPHVTCETCPERLTKANAAALLDGSDLVLDGCDNFATRALVNRICVGAKIPLIWGAISQWEGQLALFDPARGGPCLACIFPQAPAEGLAPSCAEAGVAGPLPGVIGTMMALEAVKQITGAGASLRGAMLIYDGLWGETRRISLTARAGCPVCG